MQIVIDISENVYTRLFDNGIQDNEIAVDDVCEMARAIRLGTTLSKQEPCEDCISRDEAIKPFLVDSTEEWTSADVVKYLKSLPSVTPVEKVGHWFVDERPESNREIICSNCEQPIFKYHKMDFDYRPNFCPNCGAKMREVDE